MKDDVFGTIMYDGKMINIDKENVDKLEKISADIKEKVAVLNKKAEKIFMQ